MKSKLVMVIGGILMVVLATICIVAVLKVDVTPAKESGRAGGAVRTRNFGEGIRLSQHGLYGIDLVSIGRVRMRKLRKGPFTFGAINELVLENVSLALPEELWKKGAGDKVGPARQAGDRAESGPKAMLARLGIKSDSIRMGGKLPRFSALAISNFRVSRIVDGTNAVPWFAASGAKADRAGLSLYHGWSVEGGVSNSWKEALLVLEPKLQLLTGM